MLINSLLSCDARTTGPLEGDPVCLKLKPVRSTVCDSGTWSREEGSHGGQQTLEHVVRRRSSQGLSYVDKIPSHVISEVAGTVKQP